MASDLQKYIQEDNKISSGPPARYRLPLQTVNLDKKNNETSKLRKFTLGKRSKHPNKTVLLVGATGSGKSTLINALVNFVMGVKFKDKVWFEIVEEEKNKESQAQTQTTAVSVYQVFGFEGKTVPYSLTIIDTPGYGDTRGIEYDGIVTKKLQDLFSGGVDSIDAVGLVLKATENRLDDRMAYIFNSVTSMFGKNMKQNIVALMTHSDGGTPEDALNALKEAKVTFARDEKDNPVYFTFSNRQKEPIGDDSDDEAIAEGSFKRSDKGMKKFTGFLKKATSQSVRESVEVMDKRNQLTACIKNLMERVGTIEEKQKAIKKNKEMLEKYEREMEKNENFEIEIQEVCKEQKEFTTGNITKL
uniref:Septin-type G domain-containing protein n=1 Tax=Neogobius melanostomus TaxID=47308 RepID=A0A8C6S4A7_9GOBI